MGTFDDYAERIASVGKTQREASLIREKRRIAEEARSSIAFQKVMIEGEQREVTVISSDLTDQKKICSLPGEDIKCGAIVDWKNNKWLITEKDADDELYTKATMLRCNYELRWVDDDDVIRSQWCVIEDGTKYLIGEGEGKESIATRGDTRIYIIIGRNEHTKRFDRTMRFLIDDDGGKHVLAYELTKPLKVGFVYNDEGVYKFILHETNTTDEDNQEMRIADYYKHFPQSVVVDRKETKPPKSPAISPNENTTGSGKMVWL